MSSNKTIMVICGPTASGKTSLAIEIAKTLPRANILSVDSRQLYKGLDIITGKDIPSDLPSKIKIFGIDILNSDESFNLSDYIDYSKNIIESSQKEGIPLIIVGGTGLYLKGITTNLLTSKVPPNAELRQELEKMSVAELKLKLIALDAEKFNSLNNSDANNPRRLVRAIEILSTAPGTTAKNKTKSENTFKTVGILPSKEEIERSIYVRVIERLNNGAIEEVENLRRNLSDASMQIYSSLGVKEILLFLEKKITYKEMVDLWVNSEIDYARRQMVWFKKQPDIIWYDKSKINLKLVSELANILKND